MKTSILHQFTHLAKEALAGVTNDFRREQQEFREEVTKQQQEINNTIARTMVKVIKSGCVEVNTGTEGTKKPVTKTKRIRLQQGAITSWPDNAVGTAYVQK